MSEDRIEIYRTRGLPEAYAISNLLEARGILAHIENELLQGALGDLPLGWSTAPRIIVERRHEMPARAILAEFVRDNPTNEREDDAPLSCFVCGTMMENICTCPACGWSYLRQEHHEEDQAVDIGPDDDTDESN